MFKKTSKSSKKNSHKTIAKLPTVWSLVKKTWFECTTFWRPLLGIVAIYMVLYIIFVLGFKLSTAWQDNLIYADNMWGDAINLIFGAFSSGGFSTVSQTESATLMQFILFLIASLAFIWTLRNLQALKQIKLRDAYYLGTARLIPTLLVAIILILTLLPAVIGSIVLATALQLSVYGLELLLVSLLSGVMLLLSLLLFIMFWPAFYIASLPQTRPIQALKSALKITKKRRLAILRNTVAWSLICLFAMLIILMPFAIFLPTIVAYLVFILLFVVFGFSHVYLYNLYRSLL